MSVTATQTDNLTTRAAPAAGGQGAAWLAVWTLAVRELVRFFRQRTRVVGALGQPVIFWVLFGAGLSGSFRPPSWASADLSYQAYFFPGVTVLILMFTAIFSTISIIEDRREGFLQGVLVAPIPRWSLVVGKLAGGTFLAALQAGLFLLLGWGAARVGLVAPLDLDFSLGGILATAAFVVLVGFALTALGFVIAWPMDSTQGFHAIMSVFLLPMWLVSGSFFPAAESGWMAWVIRLNPLSYGVAGLRRVMTGESSSPAAPGLPSLGVCVLVTIAFCTVCVSLAVYLANRQTSRDLR